MSVRRVIGLCLVAALVLCGPTATELLACPMCKAANDAAGQARTHAYFVSILFMLSMPFALLGGFGLLFWWTARKGAADGEGSSDDPGTFPTLGVPGSFEAAHHLT